MEIKIDVPKYHPETGITYKWENGFHIEVKVVDGIIQINANPEGLISLANHLLNLAQTEVPPQHHLHFDEFNSLEEGSLELMFQKI